LTGETIPDKTDNSCLDFCGLAGVALLGVIVFKAETITVPRRDTPLPSQNRQRDSDMEDTVTIYTRNWSSSV
jgi:hypothetical protein